MPIIRTYACEDCFHQMEVTLTAEQWDDPPPACPMCSARQLQQQFKPPGIVNGPRAQANKLVENIIGSDYHVADYNRSPSRPSLRYKDPGSDRSTWGVAQEALQSALSEGRRSRLQYGNGLDVLQANLRNGTEKDLIEESKKRAMKIW